MASPDQFLIEFDREDDGRWIALIPALPGVMEYGATRDEAARLAIALARRVLADRVAHGEADAAVLQVPFRALS